MYFQIIDKATIAVEADFFMNPTYMSIVKEKGGRFIREEKIWHIPYKNYISVYERVRKVKIS
jgi:hypothetical protein